MAEEEKKEVLDGAQETIQKEFKIPEWNSEEGKKIRIETAKKINNAAANITEIWSSSLKTKEKAGKMQTFLKTLQYGSIAVGIWRLIGHTHYLSSSFFDKFKGDFGHWEIGGVFWLKVAAFLFILRIIHLILSKGGIFFQDIKNAWQAVKKIFQDKNVQESFVSLNDYKNLQLILESEITYGYKPK
jgi:hypothetical protein